MNAPLDPLTIKPDMGWMPIPSEEWGRYIDLCRAMSSGARARSVDSCRDALDDLIRLRDEIATAAKPGFGPFHTRLTDFIQACSANLWNCSTGREG